MSIENEKNKNKRIPKNPIKFSIQLNEEQKKCIELFYLEEKSYQQVSELTGFSMLQVKSFIQNGKRNLKILMEKKHAG
jgi:RNA polymerase sigma-70 factor (ECF subfamily)